MQGDLVAHAEREDAKMKTMVFRGAVNNGERLQDRILRLLATRHLMRIGELRIRLGESEDLVRAELESLMLRGGVERIAAVGGINNDLDAYALPMPEGHPWEL